MRFRSLLLLLLAIPLAFGCDDDDPAAADAGMMPVDSPAFESLAGAQIGVGETADLTLTGLTEGQAYRITLVVAANITAAGDGTATLVDTDMNGAADAGASEAIALITMVNGVAVDAGGAKTVPGGMDDPAAPTGVFPSGGEISLTVSGVGAGTVYAVAYVNGGASTFLELAASGAPTEVYAVSGAIEVTGGEVGLGVAPAGDTAIPVGDTVDYTVTGLADGAAYRITLVVDANLTGAGDGTATFVDGDANGAADAGASERVALITSVNGMDVPNGGSRTVPGGMDDPAAPTGVFASDGQITFTVTGVATGRVHPVVYVNGGASTFLELGAGGVPGEVYFVGGSVSVTGPTPVVAPMEPATIAVAGVTDVRISGLNDAQAYRVTLVVAANVTAGPDGTGTFVDGDGNGAADSGASEGIALIRSVNGVDVDGGGARTVPGGMDDPANPTGVLPVGGSIELVISGVAPGTVYPVVYENGGASTFLELGAGGSPVEVYTVGSAITVQ